MIAHEMGAHPASPLIAAPARRLCKCPDRGALVGDVSGVSALTVNAPIILSSLHYTREAEREADQYAFALLRKSGRSPNDFADAMRRFEAMEFCLVLRVTAHDEALKQSGPNVDHRDERAARAHHRPTMHGQAGQSASRGGTASLPNSGTRIVKPATCTRTRSPVNVSQRPRLRPASSCAAG